MKLVSIAKRVGDAHITDTVSPTKTTVSFSSIPAGGGSLFDVASTARHFPCRVTLFCAPAFPGSDTLRRKANSKMKRRSMRQGAPSRLVGTLEPSTTAALPLLWRRCQVDHRGFEAKSIVLFD